MLCTRGYICGRVWFPGEVRMVSPVRVICVVVLGIGWWLVLAHNTGMLCNAPSREGVRYRKP